MQIANSELELTNLRSPLQRALLSHSLKQLVPVAYEYAKNNASQELQQQWANRLQALGLDLNKPTSAHQLAQRIQTLLGELDANDPMVQWLENASQHLQTSPALAEAERTIYELSGDFGQNLDDEAKLRLAFHSEGANMQLNDLITAGQTYQQGAIMGGTIGQLFLSIPVVLRVSLYAAIIVMGFFIGCGNPFDF